MFIATADPTDPSSVGARCDSPDIFRSYGACPIIWGSIVYKHFVPTGLRSSFSTKQFVTRDKSNTLTGTLPTTLLSSLLDEVSGAWIFGRVQNGFRFAVLDDLSAFHIQEVVS